MRELTASYTDEKRDNERFDLWLYHVGRRLSWPIAWIAVRLGISATTVTLISAAFVWMGALLIALGNPLWQLIGALFFQLWIIFDCADGSVARATGTGSKRGEYADALGGYSVSMLLYASMGMAAARRLLGLDVVVPFILGLAGLGGLTGQSGGSAGAAAGPAVTGLGAAGLATSDLGDAGLGDMVLGAAGSLSAGSALDFLPLSLVLPALGVMAAGLGASLLSLYARLLYQKYLNIFGGEAARERPIKPREARDKPIMILAQNIAANSGFALPLAFLALASGWEPVYALAYLVVNAAMLALTIRRTMSGGSQQ